MDKYRIGHLIGKYGFEKVYTIIKEITDEKATVKIIDKIHIAPRHINILKMNSSSLQDEVSKKLNEVDHYTHQDDMEDPCMNQVHVAMLNVRLS